MIEKRNFKKNQTRSHEKNNHVNERIELLGIPENEMTENVRVAVSALLEKIDDISRDFDTTKEKLSEMERLVDVDCVATIPNRRAFMRRLNWAINMYERYGHNTSILYFDINDFKEINDTYGHSAGDMAIRHIAEILSKSMRESDFLARIGGDEFAMIMYHASEQSAKKRSKIITEMLKSEPMIFADNEIELTASCGVYSIHNDDNAEKCLAAADMAMYVDKRRHKNKLEITA